MSVADHRALPKHFQRILLVLMSGLAGGLGYAVLSLPDQAIELKGLVEANLQASGVSNPVTAVLLNFRGYDTLLEMAVLLLALIGVWSLGATPMRRGADPGPVLSVLVHGLVPMMILVAGYLLWAGAHAPGGAFQAGAVLAASGVLLLLTGKRLTVRLMGRPLRIVLLAWFGSFYHCRRHSDTCGRNVSAISIQPRRWSDPVHRGRGHAIDWRYPDSPVSGRARYILVVSNNAGYPVCPYWYRPVHSRALQPDRAGPSHTQDHGAEHHGQRCVSGPRRPGRTYVQCSCRIRCHRPWCLPVSWLPSPPPHWR